jgi:hypothetical protein
MQRRISQTPLQKLILLASTIAQFFFNFPAHSRETARRAAMA